MKPKSAKMTKVQKKSTLVLQHRPIRFSPVREVPNDEDWQEDFFKTCKVEG